MFYLSLVMLSPAGRFPGALLQWVSPQPLLSGAPGSDGGGRDEAPDIVAAAALQLGSAHMSDHNDEAANIAGRQRIRVRPVERGPVSHVMITTIRCSGGMTLVVPRGGVHLDLGAVRALHEILGEVLAGSEPC